MTFTTTTLSTRQLALLLTKNIHITSCGQVARTSKGR